MGARSATLVHTECDYLEVDTSTNSTTVYNGPCIYYGAVVTTALSAHVVLVKNGTAIIDAFAASSAIGSRSHPPTGVFCATSLVLDPDDTSTGNMTVYYRPVNL